MPILKVTGTMLRVKDNSPFRDTKIEVWDRDFGLDDKLGSGRTNNDGAFEISYDTADAGDKPDLTIKVLRMDFLGKYHVIAEKAGPRDVTKDYDFGDIHLADWEYDPNFQVPLVLSEGAGITASPQNFERPQTAKIVFHGIRLGAVRLLAGLEKTIKKVQGHFAKNLTIKDKNSRSDQFFANAVLNGFAPAKLTVDDADGTYHVRYNIDDYECDDQHQSPSVHLVMEKNDNGNLIPVKIEYKVRELGSNPAVFGPMQVALPGDGESWETAKSNYRIAEFIDGQVKGHLGRGHLNVGQYAISLYRNIQKNPIFRLLHPHLKGVSAINTFGKNIIFGDQGILVISPLTPASLIQVMRDDLGQCNWKGWTPRTEVNDQHDYAKVQKVYWDLLTEYIEGFFEANLEKILREWKEVFFFSEDLVAHSVPFREDPIPSGESRIDNNEVNSGGDGDKAISAITKVTINPPQEDIANLKQACIYAIYHATIWHDWRNDNQANYGGEIDYARMAMNISIKEAAFQLFIVNILVDVKYGYLTKNEDGDIPREMMTLLKRYRPQFDAIKYDLRDLRSRINI